MAQFTDYELKVMDAFVEQWATKDDFIEWYSQRLQKKQQEEIDIVEEPKEEPAPEIQERVILEEEPFEPVSEEFLTPSRIREIWERETS